jgi:4-hydroxybenzoyl-CoA thioesterase
MSTADGLLTHARTIEIEWGDCDPAGLVYSPRYFAYFEQGTTQLFRHALGVNKREWMKAYGSAGFALVKVTSNFLLPCRFGDALKAEATLMEFRRSSFDVRHRLFKAGELAVEGTETRVWTVRDPANPERIRGEPLPAEVLEKFSRSTTG